MGSARTLDSAPQGFPHRAGSHGSTLCQGGACLPLIRACHSSGCTCLETARCLCKGDHPQEIPSAQQSCRCTPSNTAPLPSRPQRLRQEPGSSGAEGSGVRTGSLSHKNFNLPLPGSLLPANLHPAPWQVGLWDQGRYSQSTTQSGASEQPWGTSLPPS